MHLDELSDIDLSEVELAVGSAAYNRGLAYAFKRVLNLSWDPITDLLEARVVGNGAIYHTAAYFDLSSDGTPMFVEGDCSCPVGFNCKHVAAVVLTAVGDGSTSRHSVDGGNETTSGGHATLDRPAARFAQQLSWEDEFAQLLPVKRDISSDALPLAIEVKLERSGQSGAVRVMARLLREGRNGWVRSGVSWGELEPWHVSRNRLNEDHVDVARDIAALHELTTNRHRYYYSSSASVFIDLAVLDGSLWSVLRRARDVGLRLIQSDKHRNEIPTDVDAELCLDVTAGAGGRLTVTPVVRRVVNPSGESISIGVLGFLGADGHGAVCVDGADTVEHDDIMLVQLDRPVPDALRKMLMSGRGTQVPADGIDRFRRELWPRLRHVATIISSDGAFVAPQISAPTLGVRAVHGDDHRLTISFDWVYELDGSEIRSPVDADPEITGYRDPLAEAPILDTVLSSVPGLRRESGLGSRAHGLWPNVVVSGLETMRLCTEVLPLLCELPGVVVEIVGEPADFREVSELVAVTVTTRQSPVDRDWFDLEMSVSVDGREIPFVSVFTALAAGDEFMLLDDGAYFSLAKPEFDTLRELIEEARGLEDRPADQLRITRYQMSWWEELCSLGVVRAQAAEWESQVASLRGLASGASDDSGSSVTPVGSVVVPTSLEAELRPYQRDGLDWLAFLWDHGLGGILADDMGLGKTIQVLSLICRAREQDPTLAPFLVVAPTSVVSNWVAEARRFTPALSVVALPETLKKAGRTIDEVRDGVDVIVTSYALARLDADAHASVGWAGLFLDEAQHVKNHRSKTYLSLRRLPAPFKLAVTGTPMENNLMELWSLLSMTAPGLFPDPAGFTEYYCRPIERKGDSERLAQLRRRIKPLMKRRTKEVVAADLPPKQEQVLDIELHSKHRRIYETHLQRERQKVLGLLADGFDKNRFTILKSITVLRQLSLHAGLVDPDHVDVPSAKIELLVEELTEVIAGGHRALVFSQFTSFLRLVRSRLDAEGIAYSYLDGRTRKREQAIDRFKTGDVPVFLISLKAGGVGLNLTEADYCFILDPWWNPATEAQAVDRSHRIGQTKTVFVYRMISSGTIEERVQALKQRKAELFAGVMDEGDLFNTALDAEDVRGLFS